jgi:hypothetical protein
MLLLHSFVGRFLCLNWSNFWHSLLSAVLFGFVYSLTYTPLQALYPAECLDYNTRSVWPFLDWQNSSLIHSQCKGHGIVRQLYVLWLKLNVLQNSSYALAVSCASFVNTYAGPIALKNITWHVSVTFKKSSVSSEAVLSSITSYTLYGISSSALSSGYVLWRRKEEHCEQYSGPFCQTISHSITLARNLTRFSRQLFIFYRLNFAWLELISIRIHTQLGHPPRSTRSQLWTRRTQRRSLSPISRFQQAFIHSFVFTFDTSASISVPVGEFLTPSLILYQRSCLLESTYNVLTLKGLAGECMGGNQKNLRETKIRDEQTQWLNIDRWSLILSLDSKTLLKQVALRV